MAETRLNVDPGRVFAVGFSNGGMLAYRLACEAPDTFAAIAVIAATMTAPCSPSRPVSIIQFSALHDPLISYSTGYSGHIKNQGLRLEELSVVAVVAEWRQFDRCGAPTSTAIQTGIEWSHSACSDGNAVDIYTLANGVHGWPGGVYSGSKESGFEATPILLAFLAAHGRVS